MGDVIRLRKHLSSKQQEIVQHAGVLLRPLAITDPEKLHALLADAYGNGFGSVPAFEQWWPAISGDDEYDPALLLIAADHNDQPIGLALCWNSGFIKDLAVAPAWRGRGIAEALLATAFNAFRRRGLLHVDLKVMSANENARRLYHRVGMVEVPL
nr:GNAT family N-acetyltransferase [uncultured Devosia sp.]